jgi:small-conductance mechanosensitive channel
MRYRLLLLVLLICNTALAQPKYGPHPDSTDTTVQKLNFVQKMQERGKEVSIERTEKYRKGKAAIHRREAVDKLKKINQEAKIFLKEGVDTLGVNTLVNETEESIDVAKEGVFTERGTSQTQRNLSASSGIIQELTRKVEREKQSLDKKSIELINFRVKIDSLYSDPLLYKVSADSAEIAKYLKKIDVVVKETNPIDSSLDLAIANVQALQLKVDVLLFELQSLKEDIDIYSANLAQQVLSKEFPYLWEEIKFRRPFVDVVRFSVKKEDMILRYYLHENRGVTFILVVLTCVVFYFIRSLKKLVVSENHLSPDYSGQLILRFPLLSAILLVFSIFQFIYANPPYIISFIIWLIISGCLSCIFWGHVTTYWYKVWVVILIIFTLASLSNMVLQITRVERYYTLGLSIFGIVYLSQKLVSRRRTDELKDRGIFYFILFAIVLETISVMLNSWGRFNLSKTVFVSGYCGLVIAIMFFWAVRLINQGLLLASNVYKHPDRKLFFINFEKVGSEIPRFFYAILTLGWFILVARNFYSFRIVYDSVVEFFTKEQTVGHYSFSIMGIIIFFLILALAVFLSKLVSFFASDPASGQDKGTQKKKLNLGGYLLIIRIVIICMGLFIAFAAAGIALDKITVIFGALGVGVGLGLQGLVNNLVSGLIVSFERPVNVGDLIEIDGKMVTMKSIGFRSSIVTSFDGSHIVIPNGELLNKNLVNWTMGAHQKITRFIVGVAYGSDLNRVKELIMEILDADTRILRNPVFEVVIRDFGGSAIDVEVCFWPRRLLLGRNIKSDIILKIDEVFRKEGISIPFPQQDIYIKSLPEPKTPEEKEAVEKKEKRAK